MSEEIVKIKGSAAGGLQLAFAPEASYQSIYAELESKLRDGNGFFLRGTLVQFPRDHFSDSERTELMRLFHEHGLIFRPLEEPHHGSGQHAFASDMIDVAHETTPTELPTWMSEAAHQTEAAGAAAGTQAAAGPQAAGTPAATPAEAAQPAQPSQSAPGPVVQEMVVVDRTLRGGQEIRTQSSVLVCGNVNPGAQIIAGGSIDIRGTCRGMVHAGAYGDASAFVVADHLIPTQIRIADLIARSPDTPSGRPEPGDGAERASIKNGQIVIEPIKR